MTAVARPSPSQDVLQLVHALGRAEWGPLTGAEFRGTRTVLETLAQIMHFERKGRRASTTATARQISERSGYSERWTRVCLQRLEDSGLLQWERGGVIEGAPKPSRFRIVKTVLCDWIAAARTLHDERMHRYIEETRRRLRLLVYKTIRPNLRRSDHAEPTSNLPPYRGRKGAEGAPLRSTPYSSITLKEITMATLPDHAFMPLFCTHGNPSPDVCNQCRSKAWQLQQQQDKQVKSLEKQRAADAARAQEDTVPDWTPEALAYLLANYGDNPRAWARAALTDPKVREIERANA